MDKKFLMFDMDGTLLDSMHAWVMCGPEYAEQVLGERRPEITEEFAKLSIKDALYKLAALAGPDKDVSLEGLCKVLMHHYFTDCTLKAGVLEFLNKQKAAGTHMCVVTATPRIPAEPLEHLGIKDYFDFIITYDDFPSGKSNPEIFREACRRFNCDISDAAMFEDALYSIKTSTSIGLYTIGIPEKIYKANEEEIINTADLFLPNGFVDLL